MDRVAIVGHSFVWRLEEFMKRRQDKDENFGMHTRKVKCFGTSGLNMRKVHTVEEKVMEYDPDVLVLVIGDNDVDNPRMHLRGLAALIVNFANTIRRDVMVPVIISMLMPRYPGIYFNDSYNQRAIQVNQGLVEEIESGCFKNISLWRHKFVAFPENNPEKYWGTRCFFKEDGVHLNDDGNCRLYKSFRKLLSGLRPVEE